ncbi:hypothetical protein AX16_007309 [Volvariella volvacea WC 439]|nr:hypothetical protein AX16_007309 [Volvariella volvacea WC 439]
MAGFATSDFPGLPPFPDNVPTHPLLVIDYQLLKARDEKEIDRLWEAGTKLGFWYLKNHEIDDEVNAMFEMGAETMKLSLEEKMKFEQGDEGQSFGYKAAGANAVDASGTLDTVEFLNVSKDDALSLASYTFDPNAPPPLTRAKRGYPAPVLAHMKGTIAPFIKKALDVNDTILDIFNDRLGLPKNALKRRHQMDEWSGSEARCIKNPPRKATEIEQGGDVRQAIGSHTDFGSLSFLHNRLGGLQVLPPGYDEWQYVRPLPGHAICNVGDAVSLFSGGILKSNLHRVVPPPGLQGAYERWSLVYFTRPGNSVVLRALVDESPIIAEAVTKAQQAAESGGENLTNFETGSTAAEWFARRIKYQRISNRKGPETWMASRGTERIEA